MFLHVWCAPVPPAEAPLSAGARPSAPARTRASAPVLGLLPGLLLLTLLGCGEGASSAGSDVTREELPGGGVLVRHGALPEDPTHRLETDLVLGVLDGEPWEMFGQVRGVEVGSDGSLYVLDFQARAIRVFDAEGAYLRTLGGPGEGPGEISQGNGIFKEHGGLLWVNDHGKMRILGLEPNGTEVLRAPFPVPGWGFVWAEERDHAGRFWGSRGVSVGGGPSTMPEIGLNESRSTLWFHAVHPETEARDSIELGERSNRSFVIASGGGGFSMFGVPFDPVQPTVVDPRGGFWSVAGGGVWRIVHLDPAGDTVMILEADMPRAPVTAEDRASALEARVEGLGLDEATARELSRAIPDRKPALQGLFLDGEGRLWVQRARYGEGVPPRWDVFDRDGALLASVEPGFSPVAAGIPPRIRGEVGLFVSEGEEGHPVVIRTRISF